MQIRLETPTDHTAIESLTYRAFENHPHHAPGAKPTEHLIINKLRSENALTLSLVMEDEAEIVGHIAFSPVNINDSFLNWYGLGPVSVRPEYQSQGIGAALIRESLAQLKAQGAEGVVLLGEPEYYGRFGFKAQPVLTLDGVPPEYFLALSLNDDMPNGKVSYHPAFFEV